MKSFRWGIVIITAVTVLLILPAFGALSVYFGSYTVGLTVWSVSCSTLSGQTPAIIVVVIIATFVIATFVTFERFLYQHYKLKLETNIDKDYIMHDYFGVKVEFSITHVMCLCVVMLVNFSIIIALNIIFIYGSIYTSSDIASFLEFALASGKVNRISCANQIPVQLS